MPFYQLLSFNCCPRFLLPTCMGWPMASGMYPRVNTTGPPPSGIFPLHPQKPCVNLYVGFSVSPGYISFKTGCLLCASLQLQTTLHCKQKHYYCSSLNMMLNLFGCVMISLTALYILYVHEKRNWNRANKKYNGIYVLHRLHWLFLYWLFYL